MEYIYSNQLHNIVLDIFSSNNELNFNSIYREVTKIFRENKIAGNKRKGKGRKIKNPSKFTLSKNILSKTLHKMVVDGYLNVRIESSGRIIDTRYYSLTEKARNALQLQVLHKNDKQKEFKKIYKKIIFNEFLQETIIYSEEEFEEILEKLNVRKEDIEWGSVGYGSIPRISVILYPDAPFNHGISKNQQDIVNEELWEDPNVQTRNIPVEFLCFPLKGDLDFIVKKVEYWQMNKNKENKLLKIEYRFFKPGISREDLVRDEDSDKIEETIKIFQENNLIQPINFAQELRYIISDYELRNLAGIITKAFESFYKTLLIKMTYFDEPNEKEDNIMNEYFGQAEFRKIKVEKRIKRHEHKKRMKECINLNEYYSLLIQDDIKNKVNLSLILNVDIFLTQKNYLPKYRNKNVSEEDFDKNYENLYNKFLLKSVPKDESKKLVKEYHDYIKEKVDKQFYWLPVNFEGEGLEEIKLDYENVIKKYSFLKEIIDPIFPMIFEPPDLEVRKAILENELSMNCYPNNYQIEKIGNLEYEEVLFPLTDEKNIIINDNLDNDLDKNDNEVRLIPIKRYKKKVPYRKVQVIDSKTGERKEIKMYRLTTVQPL